MKAKSLEDERKRAEDEIADLNTDLDSFSYAVSHELRAPLRHIISTSEALLENRSADLDESNINDLHVILASSDKMRKIIDGLLALSRSSRAEMYVEPVDLGLIAREIIADMRSKQPNRNIDIIIPDSLIVHGDERLLRMALENLLHNAWKFTSKQESALIEFGVTNQDDKTVYYVRDDGAGFDMKYVDNMFNSFKRLHSSSEFDGVGLGLATTKRIIERHGGRIWVEGAVNQGATFYFTLSPDSTGVLTGD